MLEELSRRGVEYALKVPMHPWLGLKEVVQGCRRWRRVDSEICVLSVSVHALAGALRYARVRA